MYNYNPHDWYWLADDGRIFSSGVRSIITDTDASFMAWEKAGNSPTPWPKDNAGQQTLASLQAVLAPFDVYADLPAYAAAKRYALEVGGFIYDGHPISTDRDSQSKIGNVAVAATVIGPSFSTVWKGSDGVFFTLDHDDAITMATTVMTFVSGCFAAEAAILAAIEAGTIKTFADIDAASWAANS